MKTKRSKSLQKLCDTPLQVKVSKGKLVIEIGISTLAFSFEHSPLAQPYVEAVDEEGESEYRQAYEVNDEVEFAKDVKSAMEYERGDGSSPLTIFLDAMERSALEEGSIAIDDVDKPAKDI